MVATTEGGDAHVADAHRAARARHNSDWGMARATVDRDHT